MKGRLLCKPMLRRSGKPHVYYHGGMWKIRRPRLMTREQYQHYLNTVAFVNRLNNLEQPQ